MGILLNASNPTQDKTINYGSSGVYTGTLNFQLLSLAVSSVSSVLLTNLTVGTSSTVPNMVFALSGITLPYTMLVPDGETFSTTVGYTITANNNYLHANTTYLVLTSLVVANPMLSADTEIEEDSNIIETFIEPFMITANGDAPDPVTQLTALSGDRLVTLNWTQPETHTDWTNTIVRQALVPVTGVDIGNVVLTTTTYTVSSFVAPCPAIANETYYFAVYTQNNVGKVSTFEKASAVPTWGRWGTRAEHSRRYVQDEF